MSAISSLRARSRAESVDRRYLRLVDSNRVNSPAAKAPRADESAKAVIACLTAFGPGNSELLLKARRAARENEGEFYAVLTDPPSSRFGRAHVRKLIDDAILASCWGAKVIWLESSDRVGELLELARQSNVGQIFVSRNQPTLWSRVFGRPVYSDLLRRGRGFRIEVVGLGGGRGSALLADRP